MVISPKNKAIPALFAALFTVMVNNTILPSLVPFMQVEMQLSTSGVAALLAIFPAVAFVVNLVLGPIVDKLGSRSFILIGSIGCAAIFFLTAIAQDSKLIVL